MEQEKGSEVSVQDLPSKPIKKKKGRWGIGKILFLLVVLIFVAGITVVSLAGFVPGLSTIVGARSPKTLGVPKATQADYESALKKIDFVLDSSAGTGKDTRISYSGQKSVTATFTQAEVAALINFNHADAYPARDARIKIHSDGTLEGSSRIDVPDYKGYSLQNAVYVKSSVDVVGPKQIKLNPSSVRIGYVPVPIRQDILDFVGKEVNNKLQNIPGFSIRSISYTDGGITFDGTIPASAKRIKR